MSKHAAPINLLRAPQVCKKLQISRSSLYSKLDPRSKYYDPKFPRQVHLGISTVGWIEYQVEDWICQRALA